MTKKVRPTPETIWKHPAYLKYVQPALTTQIVSQAEERLGCKLPESFLELLRVQNGGYIRFHFPDSVGEMITGIGPQFPSIVETFLPGLLDGQEYVSFSLNNLVPFDGDGHWYLCLDYRDGKEIPCVSYIDVECDEQHRMADSFPEYLDKMELRLDGEWILQNVTGLDDAKNKLEQLFQGKFVEKTSNIGYQYHKMQTSQEARSGFSIATNRVAAGFRESKKAEFEYEGTALRFPELPAETVICKFFPDQLDAFRDQLAGAGLGLVDIEAAVETTL